MIKYFCLNTESGKRITMEPKDYKVTKIEGEYATITDIVTNDELFIALSLLPFGTDIGTVLHYENLEYTISRG